jgi:hypothetical protein
MKPDSQVILNNGEENDMDRGLIVKLNKSFEEAAYKENGVE